MWLLAILASICTVGHSSVTKTASIKNKADSSMQFNALKVGSSLLFFLLLSFYKMKFHLPTVLFASVYGFVLFFSTLFGYMALMHGSMALTSLIVSYSVIIPCCFGIFCLSEPVGVMRILGIVLLLFSMYLLKHQAESVKISKQWFIYVVVTFLCNGICSVIQKLHQMVYPSSYCNEFMIYSLCVTFILFSIISICKNGEKVTGIMRYAVIAGILMGLGNYLTLVLSSKTDATVLFPIISVLSMLCNVIVSKLYFKDKFNVMQLTGISLGVFSVLLIK